MYCMQSNKISAMSDSIIAIAAGRNLAIFFIQIPIPGVGIIPGIGRTLIEITVSVSKAAWIRLTNFQL